jgi:glucose uptake protein GlcU
MLTNFDKAIAGALGPILAWGLLWLLQALLGPAPADVVAGVQALASLAVTAGLVWLVPNRPAAGTAAAAGAGEGRAA